MFLVELQYRYFCKTMQWLAEQLELYTPYRVFFLAHQTHTIFFKFMGRTPLNVF